MPDEVKPDIKNLRQMTEVWKVLDEEYGQVMELTAELIEDLMNFQFTKEARTKDAKFTELYRLWALISFGENFADGLLLIKYIYTFKKNLIMINWGLCRVKGTLFTVK